MSALAQDQFGDLDLSSGNLRVETNPDQCTAWKLTNLFRLAKGEWFADSRLGVPYLQYVFVKNPNLGIVEQIFRKVLLFPRGVSRILSGSLDFVTTNRSLAASFAVQTASGATIEGGPGESFIVTVQGAA